MGLTKAEIKKGVIEGKLLCVSCGEAWATRRIPNPNSPDMWNSPDEFEWDVCEGCEDFINNGLEMALLETMNHISKEHGFAPSEKAVERLKELKNKFGFKDEK